MKRNNAAFVVALRCPWCDSYHPYATDGYRLGKRVQQITCGCGASGPYARTWLVAVREWNKVAILAYSPAERLRVPAYQYAPTEARKGRHRGGVSRGSVAKERT